MPQHTHSKIKTFSSSSHAEQPEPRQRSEAEKQAGKQQISASLPLILSVCLSGRQAYKRTYLGKPPAASLLRCVLSPHTPSLSLSPLVCVCARLSVCWWERASEREGQSEREAAHTRIFRRQCVKTEGRSNSHTLACSPSLAPPFLAISPSLALVFCLRHTILNVLALFCQQANPPPAPIRQHPPPKHWIQSSFYLEVLFPLSLPLSLHSLTCTHIHTTLYTQSPAIGRGRERQRESKQARGRHLSSLLRALQVPKMAENKQEPRQVQKPGRRDGQTRQTVRERESCERERRRESETETGQTGGSQMAGWEHSVEREVEGKMEALKGYSCHFEWRFNKVWGLMCAKLQDKLSKWMQHRQRRPDFMPLLWFKL